MVQKKNYRIKFPAENIHLFRLKLIGLINKDGKKNIATKIVNNVLSKAASRFKVTAVQILVDLFEALDFNLEIKKVRIRRSVSIVPFSVSRNRKIFLIVKNLLSCAKQDSGQVSFEKKLYEEISRILTGQPCNSIKNLKDNRFLAKQHRSNAHFRW